jgi:MtN3 and saliva related transmembrane protein
MSGFVSPFAALAALPGFNAWPHALPYSSDGIVGTIAAIFTTISLVPQLVRVWSRKCARDISFGMFFLFSTGVLLWFIYGVLIHSLPVEVANGISFVFSLTILGLKLYYDRKEC